MDVYGKVLDVRAGGYAQGFADDFEGGLLQNELLVREGMSQDLSRSFLGQPLMGEFLKRVGGEMREMEENRESGRGRGWSQR